MGCELAFRALRMREIAEVVASRQDKMLVFTQFREMADPLATFLGRIFGRPGLGSKPNQALESEAFM